MPIYCVYITFYRGNKLPPFYIGSTTIKKLNKGYRGSVRSKMYRSIWEDELKLHPELFNTKCLSTHDDHGNALEAEAKLQTSLNVINNPLYVNQGIAKRGFGNLSIESRRLISQKAKLRDYTYMKGSNHYFFGGRPADFDQSGAKNPYARKCKLNGIVFDSIKQAADYFGIVPKKCYKLVERL